jgi:putative membrane protein
MVSILVTWLISAAAVWITAAILPGFKVKGFGSAMGVAAIFGILNALLGWILFHLFSIGTLGLGYLFAFLTVWVVNAILLKITDAMTDSLKIEGWFMTFIGAASISFFTSVGRWVLDAI